MAMTMLRRPANNPFTRSKSKTVRAFQGFHQTLRWLRQGVGVVVHQGESCVSVFPCQGIGVVMKESPVSMCLLAPIKKRQASSF